MNGIDRLPIRPFAATANRHPRPDPERPAINHPVDRTESFRAPIPGWLAGYRKEWLRPDLVAGLTAAAVVIPKAMAYATIAGLPVQVGLYTALVPMVIYAVLGTSRVLSVSTTTAH